MSSLIEGYNYDIFISYRQKDNKGDHWVSEFVEALKTELESTFKEEISVYFDINPHDGLLETHDVDASLKDKLKCLIFIPIISRTYCDPKSFAWEHEFKVFVEVASKDQFGLKIKLSNGNVASRMLPVRIHDLDNEDVKCLEGLTGGVIRTLDFVFRTASGVNRPLKVKEDHPNDNLNQTYYQDQINKVALAIREIITSIKHYKPQQSENNEIVIKSVTPSRKIHKTAAIWISVITLLLIVLGVITIPKFIYPSMELEKSLAVLPFENLSSDEDKVWFNEGIADIIINQLTKISDIKVLPRTSTLKYKNGKKSGSEIGRELKVNYIIEGTVQRQEEKMRITVKLIRVPDENNIWSDVYDRDWKDIFEIQTDIAQRISSELKTFLTPEEEMSIREIQTKNSEAYNLYLQGRLFWYTRTENGLQKSVEYFKKAIEIDPDYALANAGLADAYFIQAYWGWIPWIEGASMSKELALKSLSIDNNLAEGHTVLGALLNYKDMRYEEARKEFQMAIELNPNFVTAHHYYSELLNLLRKNRDARNEINVALKLDPYLPVLHVLSSRYYYKEGKLKEALEECKIIEELDPEYGSRTNYLLEFYIYIKIKDDLKALEALTKALYSETSQRNLILDLYQESGMNGILNWLIQQQEPEKSYFSLFNLAVWLNMAGKHNELLDLLEKTLSDPHKLFVMINNNPDFDNIRSEPRFQAIIKKIGLSEYQEPD